MTMTESEICLSYQQAKSKKRQIRVLAELNATTQTEIRKILEKNNYSTRKSKVKRAMSDSKIYDSTLCERYVNLADAGLDTKQIASKLGMTEDAVRRFLRRHKIITAPTKSKERTKKNGDDRI